MEVSKQELQRWQLWAQHLTQPADRLTVGAGLCGLQAQYGANALHSLRLRSGRVDTDGFVKAWTLRGTLHLFPASDLPLYIPAAGVEGIFDTPYGQWLYDGHCQVSKDRMLFFARLLAGALCDTPIPRDELKDLCRTNGMTADEEERVFSGWGGVIRLLAESGVLCVSADVNRAYIRCPVLPSIPREQAEQALMERYVRHYGPVTLHDAMYFFRWTQKKIRDLLTALPVQTLTCQGRTYYYLQQPDVLPPLPRCVFLAGFDPLLLGYEKKESLYLPPAYRKRIFNNTGIVFPALLVDGVIRGRWKEQPRRIDVELFEPLSRPLQKALEKEAARLWPDKPGKIVAAP